MMQMVAMRFLGLLMWITSHQANGFASNLIVTTVGCMTELDTSEVIMNNMVR
jgi:hypothetical protein